MKSKKIILVSHCVLNQNAVIEGWGRAKGAFPIVSELIANGVGIIQLPCPELLFLGINRPPMTYQEYNTQAYRQRCDDILTPYLEQIRVYLQNGHQLKGILGIQNSPSCGISGVRGVFMEVLFERCKQQGIPLQYVEIPETYNADKEDVTLKKNILELLGED